jgi:hypothetical protein
MCSPGTVAGESPAALAPRTAKLRGIAGRDTAEIRQFGLECGRMNPRVRPGGMRDCACAASGTLAREERLRDLQILALKILFNSLVCAVRELPARNANGAAQRESHGDPPGASTASPAFGKKLLGWEPLMSDVCRRFRAAGAGRRGCHVPADPAVY